MTRVQHKDWAVLNFSATQNNNYNYMYHINNAVFNKDTPKNCI